MTYGDPESIRNFKKKVICLNGFITMELLNFLGYNIFDC